MARLRLAISNDYEIVVAGTAGVLSRFADRVEVVELDSGVPVRSEVDLVLYDSFGQHQGTSLDPAAILGDTSASLVVFSWNTHPDLVASSLAAGAVGYLPKSLTGADLVAALERIHGGEVLTPASFAPVPTADADGVGPYPGAADDLSPREAEVLALICQGLSNEEVAERAILGINTVKTYIRSLYRKIGAESRSQAVLWGVDHGFRPDHVRYVSDTRPARHP